jgi:hypothetical protein
MERFATLPIFAARLGAPPRAMPAHRQGIEPRSGSMGTTPGGAAALSIELGAQSAPGGGENRRVPSGLRRGRPICGGARLADSVYYRLRRLPCISADRARNAAAPISQTGSFW